MLYLFFYLNNHFHEFVVEAINKGESDETCNIETFIHIYVIYSLII